MAAIMEVPSIFIFTHDSIGVGEDGPTHQPVEQLCFLAETQLDRDGVAGNWTQSGNMGEPGLVRNSWVKTVWSHKRDCRLAGTHYIISSVGTLCLGEAQVMISLQ